MSHEFHMQPDERILVRTRKHWFILSSEVFGTALADCIGVGILIGVLGFFPSIPAAFPVFAAMLWLAIVSMAIAHIWTSYFLDIWIVTDKRIVFIEQVRLFYREITTLRIERIQDATVKYKNILETMLDFGTLRIQSAGAIADDLEVYGIPHPERVKQLVLEEVDRQAKERTDSVLSAVQSIADDHTGT